MRRRAWREAAWQRLATQQLLEDLAEAQRPRRQRSLPVPDQPLVGRGDETRSGIHLATAIPPAETDEPALIQQPSPTAAKETTGTHLPSTTASQWDPIGHTGLDTPVEQAKREVT